jgi:hypothetical protein
VWRFKSYEVWRYADWQTVTDVSVELAASISDLRVDPAAPPIHSRRYTNRHEIISQETWIFELQYVYCKIRTECLNITYRYYMIRCRTADQTATCTSYTWKCWNVLRHTLRFEISLLRYATKMVIYYWSCNLLDRTLCKYYGRFYFSKPGLTTERVYICPCPWLSLREHICITNLKDNTHSTRYGKCWKWETVTSQQSSFT